MILVRLNRGQRLQDAARLTYLPFAPENGPLSARPREGVSQPGRPILFGSGPGCIEVGIVAARGDPVGFFGL